VLDGVFGEAIRSRRARRRPGLRLRSVRARRPRPLTSQPVAGFPAIGYSAHPDIPPTHSRFLTLSPRPRPSQLPLGLRPPASEPAVPHRPTSPLATGAPLDALSVDDPEDRPISHPTTFVIDRNGVVRWKFIEGHYKIRPTNDDILAALGDNLIRAVIGSCGDSGGSVTRRRASGRRASEPIAYPCHRPRWRRGSRPERSEPRSRGSLDVARHSIRQPLARDTSVLPRGSASVSPLAGVLAAGRGHLSVLSPMRMAERMRAARVDTGPITSRQRLKVDWRLRTI